MKSIVFLIIGLILSITSKGFQFLAKSKLGDVLVLFAAIFFVLAILYTIPAYRGLFTSELGVKRAIFIAAFACLAVVSFQLFAMITFGYGQKIGFTFLVPFAVFTLLLLKKVFF